MPRGAENREAGESPARSRHCKQGVYRQRKVRPLMKIGKAAICEDL